MSRMNQNIRTAILTASFLSFTVMLCGCASRASTMVPSGFEIKKQHPYAVSVEVVGGRETNPLSLWPSQISTEAFSEALGIAIAKSGVFKAVIKGKGADYLLDVTILKLEQPLIGVDMTVKMETKWAISKVGEYKVIWEDSVSTTYKARIGEALIAAERLQLANEGAARENIKEGIRRLSQLEL